MNAHQPPMVGGTAKGRRDVRVQHQRPEGVPAPLNTGKEHARLVQQRLGHECAVRVRWYWSVDTGISTNPFVFVVLFSGS